MKNEVIENFMKELTDNIDYWDSLSQQKTCKEKLESLTFSILVMLDGCSGSFDGDIQDIANKSSNLMLHEVFGKFLYELKNNNEK